MTHKEERLSLDRKYELLGSVNGSDTYRVSLCRRVQQRLDREESVNSVGILERQESSFVGLKRGGAKFEAIAT